MLSKKVKRVDFLIQSKLKNSINPTYFKNVNFIEFVKNEAEYDYWISLMSLPYILNKYNYPQPTKNAFIIDKKIKLQTSRPAIGLCWRGSKNHVADEFRSIKLEKFLEIIKLDADFFILQNDLSLPENKFLQPYKEKIHVLLNSKTTFQFTASVINNLDLVVTVDTCVMHLAASLNISTIGLLGKKCDYRWGNETKKTNFYKKLEFIRQEDHYEWQDEILQVKEKISLLFNL